jgi:hypothetical protein
MSIFEIYGIGFLVFALTDIGISRHVTAPTWGIGTRTLVHVCWPISLAVLLLAPSTKKLNLSD